MENTVQIQLDISKSLLQALDSMVNSYESMQNMTANQTSGMQRMMQSMQKSDDLMQATASKSENMAKEMTKSVSESFSANFEKQSKNAVSAINKSSDDNEKIASRSKRTAAQNDRLFGSIKDSSKKIDKSMKTIGSATKALDKAIDKMENIEDSLYAAKKGIGFLASAVEKFNMIKDGFMSFGASLLYDVPKLLWSLLKNVATAVMTIISSATKFFMMTMSIPFTIAKFAANIGNTIRRDLVEVIQAAGEEAKESFDLTSHIGKGAAKMTQMSKGLLKQFNTPRSRLAQLFGMGASGIASFQKETFKLVEGMGHYSEIFGATIMKDLKVAQALIEAQRAMGLNAQQMAYYAQEAYNSGKDPTSLLIDLGTTLKKTAKDNGLDFKALSKEFHTLRTNIVDFGNLSSNEIMGLTVKLRKMGVKTDDAVNVFKKFTSLEEASKASAMLFQSFEMNIDAFDLLTSRDPGEMLTQFREAMFQTGRSFKDLNRHEKALMQNITGISENGLNSLMNFMSYGLTYDEARKRMEEQDPTAQQTEMLKGLTSTIKMVQKTMMFDSPFTAFFRGLTNNAANQKDLKNSVLSLSKLYESFYHLGFSMNLDEIKSFLGPVTVVLTNIKGMLTSNKFMKILKQTTKTVGGVLGDLGNDLQNDIAKEYYRFGLKVEKMTELAGKSGEENLKKAESVALQSLLGTTKGMNKDLLKNLREKGILKAGKKGVFKILKGLSMTQFLSKMQSISNMYDPNSPIQKEIAKIRKQVEESYDKSFDKFEGSFKENLNKANQSANERGTIAGRIDNLYDQMNELIKEGTPMFNTIKDIGGRVMGSVIKGMMYGFAAGLRLLSGNLEMAVESLGINPQKKALEEVAKTVDKPVDKLSAFDLMGISTDDKNYISDELGKESSRMVLNLPTFMSMAGSFLSDLSEVFLQFAGGILGIIGEFAYGYFKSAPWWTKIAMKSGGFDPNKALAYKTMKKLSGKNVVEKLESLNKELASSKGGDSTESDQKKFHSQNQAKSKTLMMILEEQKNEFNKKSNAYRVIEESQKALKGKNVLAGSLSNAIYSILETAERANSHAPKELFEKYQNDKVVFPYLLEKDKGSIKMVNDKINLIKNETQSVTWAKNLSSFGGSKDFVNDHLLFIKQSRNHAKTNLIQMQEEINKLIKESKKQKTSDKKEDKKAEDYHLKGKGAIISIGNYRYHLHDHDAIYAAKKGGFLNKIYIEIFETYNLFTQDLISVFNQRIEESNKEITEAKSTISKLRNNHIKSEDYNNEASADEIFDIFNLCLDVINESLNKKSVSRNVKAQIAV